MATTTCPHCGQRVPPTHYYPRSGKPRCAHRLVWTLPRRWQLMTLLEEGLSDAAIGARLGCTAAAVTVARKRYGIASRRDSTLCAREVARRMGVGCDKTVARWIARGYLPGHRGAGSGPHAMWYVTREALLDFIADERTWHLWTAERIADDRLRAWAVQCGRDRVHYLTVGEAAWRLCAQVGTVNVWIHRGLLPARRWGNWWIDERDVAAFVPPSIGGQRQKEAA